jgi:FkbM family methyltransferase
MLKSLQYEFIRTPLERPLMWLRGLAMIPFRWVHPELGELSRESRRIDRILARRVGESSNCVDVGCHRGAVLSAFCRLAPRGRHVAFEAIPEKVRFLQRKFPDVDVRGTALADRSGTVTFYVDQASAGYSGLARQRQASYQEIEVPCARLDDVVPRDRRFDFMKIDVEGAELAVLRGAKDFLARDRPTVLFECTPDGPPAFGYRPGELHDLFVEYGYAVYFLRDALENGPPAGRAAFEEAHVFPFKAFNWLALPNEPVDAARS